MEKTVELKKRQLRTTLLDAIKYETQIFEVNEYNSFVSENSTFEIS